MIARSIPILAILLGSLAARAQVPVPANGCYLAAFTPRGHDNFTQLAQKPIAIEMDYHAWSTFDFPASAYSAVTAKGSIPHMTWEPWNYGADSASYTLQNIINGEFDGYLQLWAEEIKAWGQPIMIRWGHEMNGNWYPWDGYHNGGGTLTGFGDPTKPDGPERYVAAYRHIHQIFDSVGAANVTWIWSVNCEAWPAEAWNAPENYYPGDDVVDWIGLDGYNWGTSQPWTSWKEFNVVFGPCYTAFKGKGKPMMIAEFASTELGGDKANWIKYAYLYIRLVYTQIKAVTWFDINKETNWNIDSSPAALQAYRTAVADPYFLGTVTTTAVSDQQHETGPSAFALAVYPNPFNPSTTIGYTVGGIGDQGSGIRNVKLTVYNVLGQEVAVLVNEQQAPGRYTVRFDAHRLPSGVYLVAATVGANRLVQKIVFMR